MSSSYSCQEWFEYARRDLRVAVFLQGMHPIPIGIICYHCSQAAEKMLKGVLAAVGQEPPKTHDLVMLCELCGERYKEYSTILKQCAELTPYGVQTRYPSHEELIEQDMKDALRQCQEVCEFVECSITLEEEPEQGQEEASGIAPMSL